MAFRLAFVIALVVMQVTAPLALSIERTGAILRNHGIHPCLQILQHPWVSVLVDGEAGTGVEAGQMQHTQLDACGSKPAVELIIQSGEALTTGADFYLVKRLAHRCNTKPPIE